MTTKEKLAALEFAQSVVETSKRISPKFSEKTRMKNREYFLAVALLNALADNAIMTNSLKQYQTSFCEPRLNGNLGGKK